MSSEYFRPIKELNEDQIQILKNLLRQICAKGVTIPRAQVFKEFEKIANSGIEKYRFEKCLSTLVKSARLPEYEIKVGRNGGIALKADFESIIITCSRGEYVGTMPANELDRIISSMKKK